MEKKPACNMLICCFDKHHIGVKKTVDWQPSQNINYCLSSSGFWRALLFLFSRTQKLIVKNHLGSQSPLMPFSEPPAIHPALSALVKENLLHLSCFKNPRVKRNIVIIENNRHINSSWSEKHHILSYSADPPGAFRYRETFVLPLYYISLHIP